VAPLLGCIADDFKSGNFGAPSFFLDAWKVLP